MPLFNNKLALTGFYLLLLFVLVAFLAPLIAPIDPWKTGTPYLPPGGGNLLGTNDVGQDLFGELLYGSRVSLFIGFFAAFLSTGFGIFIGLAAGFFRGNLEAILMRLADLFFLVPPLPLIIVLAAYLEPGIWNVILAIALLGWAGTARVVRSRVIQVRDLPFVKSARAMGGGCFYIMFCHILPNAREVVLARGALAVAGAMLTEAGVSFLGLGDPVQKSWGMMLHYAFSRGGFVNGYWWWYLPPALCISLAVLGFVLLGYAGGPGREEHPALAKAFSGTEQLGRKAGKGV